MVDQIKTLQSTIKSIVSDQPNLEMAIMEEYEILQEKVEEMIDETKKDILLMSVVDKNNY